MQAAINGLPKEQRPEVLVSASAVGTSQVLHRPARIIQQIMSDLAARFAGTSTVFRQYFHIKVDIMSSSD